MDVLNRKSGPRLLMAAPVVMSFMLDAGTSIVPEFMSRMVRPSPVIAQMLNVDWENAGSCIISSASDCMSV